MGELAVGALGGLMHVLMGADHLAAVAPTAALTQRCRWVVGVRWGTGHALGTGTSLWIVVSAGHAAFGSSLAAWAEVLGGVLLLVAGACHLLAHEVPPGSPEATRSGTTHSAATARTPPEVFGVLHGLGGGIALLPAIFAAAMGGSAGPTSLLAGFAIGSTATMAAFSSSMGPLASACSAFRIGRDKLQQALALVSLGVGAWWVLIRFADRG